ncbi:MAG: hypothetical protein VYE67_10795 [Planctomycetota bacterium]|nr:hypothetical protein [Planctomycetota bacterium]
MTSAPMLQTNHGLLPAFYTTMPEAFETMKHGHNCRLPLPVSLEVFSAASKGLTEAPEAGRLRSRSIDLGTRQPTRWDVMRPG